MNEPIKIDKHWLAMDDDISWNHRVVEFENGWLEIAEVYYDGDDVIGHTASGVRVCGNSIDELRSTLQRMLDCLDKPIVKEME